MTRAHRRALPVLLAAAVGSPAFALDAELAGSPLHLTISEWATTAWHVDNGIVAPPSSPYSDPTSNNFGDWLNRFELGGAWRDLTLTLRLDSALYANQPVAAPGDVRLENKLAHRYQNRLDVEKVAVSWTSRHLDVTVGDFYATFGRGLVLALRKVDVLGVDMTARGASLTGKAGDLTVNVLGGFSNVVNVDAATARYAENPNDLVLGAHADYRVAKWLVPGVNVSLVPSTLTFSGTLEAPSLFGVGTAFLEYARQPHPSGDAAALYASASVTFGAVTVLGELKDYRKFTPLRTSLESLREPEQALTNTYNTLPSLERLEQAVLNNSDVTGPRVRVDVTVSDRVTPFVSVAAFEDRQFGARIYDPYAGCELSWQEGRSRAAVSGGYRPSFQDDGSLVGAGALLASVWHGKFLVSQRLPGPFSLELNGLHVSHRDLVSGRLFPWVEGQAYLSLKSAGTWSVALGYEYFTEAPAVIRTQYLNASASWTVSQALTLRAFAGGQRGGTRCVNGICRTYQAFDGARLEVVAKF